MKGCESYDNGTKETWRGWQWNRIVERLCDFRPLGPAGVRDVLKDKTVLYLVGPNDRDRELAVKRGFQNQNVFAVDICADRIASVRASGGFGVTGSLQQVIMKWPADWPIDVVIADFCAGLNNDAMGLVNCLASSPAISHSTALSVNMMRGRDPESNEIRTLIDEAPPCPWFPSDYASELKEANKKHRGVQWYMRTLSYFRTILDPLIAGRKNVECELVLKIGERMAADFHSYKSRYDTNCVHVYDSVVCLWPMNLYDPLNPEPDRARSMGDIASRSLSKKAKENRNVKGRIAALRAVRTKRIGGQQ